MNPPAGSFLLLRRATTSVCLLLAIAATRADDWAPNISFAPSWNDNASNADSSRDAFGALKLSGDLLASQRYVCGRDDSLHAGLHLSGEWWPRFNGLTSGGGGVRGEWQHKFGVDAHAPILSLEGAADAVAAKESVRRGFGTGVTLALRKRFNDLTRGTIAQEFSWYDARSRIFDRAASETSVEVDRDLTDVTRLTLTARYRDGDIVSYATGPRPDLDALAPHRGTLGTFGHPMTAYRIDAKTWSMRVAISHATSQSSAIVAAYEWRDTRRAPLSFTNNILSLAFVHQY